MGITGFDLEGAQKIALRRIPDTTGTVLGLFPKQRSEEGPLYEMPNWVSVTKMADRDIL